MKTSSITASIRMTCFMAGGLALAACASSTRTPAHDPLVLGRLGRLGDACKGGNAEACQQTCAAGVNEGCNEAGHLYELGVNVQRDGGAASAFYRKACDGGDMAGCFNAGYVLQHGISGHRDPHCALALYRYSCDGGYLRGCLTAGFMYKSGLDVPADRGAAAQSFKRACDGGFQAGCQQLETVRD